MNYAEQAKNAGYQFEAKKDALRQTQDGGVKVTLSIHPQDMPSQLYGDAMGQRYMCVIVPLNEDETPKVAPVKEGKNYTASAKMLAKNESFHAFLRFKHDAPYTEETSELYIENICGVGSCSEINGSLEAAKRFRRLYAQFKEWEQN